MDSEQDRLEAVKEMAMSEQYHISEADKLMLENIQEWLKTKTVTDIVTREDGIIICLNNQLHLGLSTDLRARGDDQELHNLFHKLWTKNLSETDYVKADWMRLAELLYQRGVSI